MVDLPFKFRESTEDEIYLFSEEFSNEYHLNPEIKFYTAILQNENYAIFATKEENNEVRILFFLILEHSLKDIVNVYNLFCDFAKEMTFIEPNKGNLGMSKRICWNLQAKKYHMFFEEVVYTKGGDHAINLPEIYKDGQLIKYYFEVSTWKEKVNLVERYYFQQKLSLYDEMPMSPEKYSDYKYAILLNMCNEDLSELTSLFSFRNYDSKTKKVIPLSKNVLNTISIHCKNLMDDCIEYTNGTPVWTEFLEKEMKLLKEYAAIEYDKIWQTPDLNEPYLAEIKTRLARIFRLIRSFKLPEKGE